MKQLFIILSFFFSLQSIGQGRDQLAGTWLARNADSTSKNKTEIEFQFKKNSDYIVIRSKGRLKIQSGKSTVNIFESQSFLSYQTLDNGRIHLHRFRYSFPSEDVLVLTNADDPNDLITLDRKRE